MENTYKSLGKTKPLDVGTYVIYKKDTDTYVDYTTVIDTLQRKLQNNISVHNIREIAGLTMKTCNTLYKEIKNATKSGVTTKQIHCDRATNNSFSAITQYNYNGATPSITILDDNSE